MSFPSDTDNGRITAHFSSLLDAHGFSSRSLDWGSRQSQELRFAVLAAIGDLAGASILDVGCGLADFHEWLVGQGVAHDYAGLDLTPEMVARVRSRFPDVAVHQGEALTSTLFEPRSFDYVFASGIFYLRQDAPDDYLRETVARLFSWCRRGVAFNSLSSWSPRPEPGEYQADPLAVALACRALTPRVVLRHDYHPGDFTMYLYRGDAS